MQNYGPECVSSLFYVDPGHASPAIVGLVKQLEQDVRKQFEELRLQLASSSSSMASTSYPDKGFLVRNSTARLHLPPPLIGKEAENMWPEESWNSRERRSAEKDFRELVNKLRYCASSPWNIKVTGSSSSVCGRDLKPDVLIYKRPQSPGVDPVPLTTGVILELKSGAGKYNNDSNLGKAAHYGEKMLEHLRGFRSSVLVGVTDLEKVQWFKVIRTGRNIFKYEVHDELNDVRGSLCALLNISLGDLGVELPSLTVCGVEHEPIRFLGSGATSNVLCVKGEDGREYATKVPLSWKDLENDHRMLTALDHVEGVPKVLGWFDDGGSLKIHPVGRQLSRKYLSSWSWMVPGLVDVLRKAHDLGIINRDVRPDNIMIAKGESEGTEMLYILDWGYGVGKNQLSVFSGGVLYASERILGQLADGDCEVLAEGRDDLEALVHTIFSFRFHEKHKMLRGLKRHDFGELRMFWSKCSDEYPAWKAALTAARSGDYLKLKCEFGTNVLRVHS